MAGVVVLAVVIVGAVFLLNRPPSSDLSSCLVGAWTVTSQQATNTIDGQSVQFTGDNGWQVVFHSDGSVTESWVNSQLTTAVDGNNWEEIVNGTANEDAKTSGDQIIYSHESASGTYKILENDIVNNTGQLQLEKGSYTFTCSGSSFQERSGNGLSTFMRLPS